MGNLNREIENNGKEPNGNFRTGIHKIRELEDRSIEINHS